MRSEGHAALQGWGNSACAGVSRGTHFIARCNIELRIAVA
jgi:hypothetical protein